MSNFASLLGNLRQTAAKAAEAQQEEHPHKHPRSTQHHIQDSNATKAKRRRHEPSLSNTTPSLPPLPPYDIDELRTEVSFLCIGAQKAGTTWLHEILRRHPHLSLPNQKEVHFWDWNRRRGLGWYGRQFPSSPSSPDRRAGTDQQRWKNGEITPCYMALGERHVREIAFLFPRLRVVFLARDLVDRAWSAITMELRNEVRGLPPGTFASPFSSSSSPSSSGVDERREEARIDREADPSRYSDEYFMERLRHKTHTDRSDYAGSLKLWTTYFPPEQLLVLDYQDVAARPRELVRKVMEHIGVETDVFLGNTNDGRISVVEDVLEKRFNPNEAKSKKKGYGALRPSLRQKMEEYLKPYSKEFNSLLQELGYSWKLDEYEPDAVPAAIDAVASVPTTTDVRVE